MVLIDVERVPSARCSLQGAATNVLPVARLALFIVGRARHIGLLPTNRRALLIRRVRRFNSFYSSHALPDSNLSRHPHTARLAVRRFQRTPSKSKHMRLRHMSSPQRHRDTEEMRNDECRMMNEKQSVFHSSFLVHHFLSVSPCLCGELAPS